MTPVFLDIYFRHSRCLFIICPYDNRPEIKVSCLESAKKLTIHPFTEATDNRLMFFGNRPMIIRAITVVSVTRVRVRTPPKGRSPKRVWFIEMLRRVKDEPETLPAWQPPGK